MISLRGPSRSTARRCTRPIRLLNAPLTKLAETRRRQPDRAPPDAPDGAFLADSLPQILRRDLRLPASANRLKIGLVGNLRVRRPFSPHENDRAVRCPRRLIRGSANARTGSLAMVRSIVPPGLYAPKGT